MDNNNNTEKVLCVWEYEKWSSIDELQKGSFWDCKRDHFILEYFIWEGARNKSRFFRDPINSLFFQFHLATTKSFMRIFWNLKEWEITFCDNWIFLKRFQTLPFSEIISTVYISTKGVEVRINLRNDKITRTDVSQNQLWVYVTVWSEGFLQILSFYFKELSKILNVKVYIFWSCGEEILPFSWCECCQDWRKFCKQQDRTS